MLKKRKVYISGPISGLPREAYLARFGTAERVLKNEGYEVVNPTKLLPCRWPWVYRLLEIIAGGGTAYRIVLLYDLWHMMKCNNIYLLPGWKESTGARIEQYAAWRLGIDRLDADESKHVYHELIRTEKRRNKA